MSKANDNVPVLDRLWEKLRSEAAFTDLEGQVLARNVYDAAMRLDETLLDILMSDDSLRRHFFKEVKGALVFDKIAFGWMIKNRSYLADSYTRFRNRIGLGDAEGNLLTSNEEIVIDFPYKDCVLQGGQSNDDDKGRAEVFYNALLAPDTVDQLMEPKVFGGARRHQAGSVVEENVLLKHDDNMVIKGNNLLVASSLLPILEGRVKCIYLDPPYNPSSNANTFAYNNRFNRATWLVFMKNRLEVAKRLLSPDGVMIVAIDKNEQPRLQLLIEEIFAEHNVDCITIVHNPRGASQTNFSYLHEYAIFVTPPGKQTVSDRQLEPGQVSWAPLRNWGGESLRSDAKNCFYPIMVKDMKIVGFGEECAPDQHPRQTEQVGDVSYIYPIDSNGVERKWRWARQSVESVLDRLRVKKTDTGFDIEMARDRVRQPTVWNDPRYDAGVHGTQLLRRLVPNNSFSYPKSLYTVEDCIEAVVRDDQDAIVLDLFAGSGTTGHAVMDINRRDGGRRRFILVEQMDYADSLTLQRNLAAMKDMGVEESIVYCEMLPLNQRFVEQIRDAATDLELCDIWDEMKSSALLCCSVDIAAFADDAGTSFDELSTDAKRNFLMEILDKNQLYVNVSDLDDADFAVSAADRAFTRDLYKRGEA